MFQSQENNLATQLPLHLAMFPVLIASCSSTVEEIEVSIKIPTVSETVGSTKIQKEIEGIVHTHNWIHLDIPDKRLTPLITSLKTLQNKLAFRKILRS